jgi:hypothetical protein
MNSPPYRHTQRGYVLAAVLIVAAINTGVVAYVAASAWLGLLTVVMLALAAACSALTVELRDDQLQFYFGLGFPRWRIKLADIVAAEPARDNPAEGWGLRVTGSGMLYNVGGLDSVRLTLVSGKSMRIGTDDPQALILAVMRAKASGHP